VKIARNLSVKELLMSNLESWGVVVSYKNLWANIRRIMRTHHF
jgi:hypothetical protein